MTDQNQKPVGEKTDGSNSGSASRNRRNRHHRHYKHTQNNNERENTAPKAEGNAPAAEKSAEPHVAAEQQNGHAKKGDRNKNHRNHSKKERSGDRNGRGGNRRFTPDSRPYDPYETPSKEEIALSELRAQIVLQSADGTVPTAYSVNPTPTPEAPAVQSDASDKEAQTAGSNETDTETTVQTEAETEAEPVPMVEVVGIRFRSAGKMYYFDPNGITVKKGDYAIVETTRGPEFGDICLPNTMIKESNVVSPLRPLIRIATPEDVAQNAANREKEKSALSICQEKIEKHGLEMKLIDVQYAFDGSKLLFYFAAEGRVDFRELVKDLASVFRTRIELRQIGIRDEAKMLGGIGACGRPLCCSTFLPDFAQVSIKMAKDQNLSLNSSKISGVCGRLMCCLRYESEVYAEEIRKTPSNDTLVRTEDGVGVVIGSNPLAGTIRVVLKDAPDTAPKQYHRDQVVVLGKEKKGTERKNPDSAESAQ